MQRLLDVCTNWANKWRIEFGISKCGILIPTRTHSTPRAVSTLPELKLAGEPVPWVKEYRYLGLPLTHEVSWESVIKDRAEATRGAFARVRRALVQRNLAMRTKPSIVCTIITPTALCGSELRCTGHVSMQPLQKVVDEALRLAMGSHKSNTGIVHMEVGFLPLHLQALQLRLGRMKAWSALKAAEWPARIVSRTGRGFGVGIQTWKSKSATLVRLAGLDALRGRAIGHSHHSLKHVLADSALKSLQKTATAKPTIAGYLRDVGLKQWHAHIGQPYAVGKGSERWNHFGAAMLHRTRAHSATLAAYLVRSGVVADARCPHCRGGVKEDRVHFLLHCTAWRLERQAWMDTLEQKLGSIVSADFCKLRKYTSEEEFVAVLLGGRVSEGRAAISRSAAESVRKHTSTIQEAACEGVGKMYRARFAKLPLRKHRK